MGRSSTSTKPAPCWVRCRHERTLRVAGPAVRRSPEGLRPHLLPRERRWRRSAAPSCPPTAPERVNHLDTAQFCGAGTVNELIREALSERRSSCLRPGAMSWARPADRREECPRQFRQARRRHLSVGRQGLRARGGRHAGGHHPGGPGGHYRRWRPAGTRKVPLPSVTGGPRCSSPTRTCSVSPGGPSSGSVSRSRQTPATRRPAGVPDAAPILPTASPVTT